MKQRKDSFFGLHFDFHASPEKGTIGEDLREKDIREICTLLHPDFLQIDCKGHPGWASYPTECGNAMPKIIGDPLALWRRVTKEEDVALFLHYSGVWDGKFSKEHPEQAVLHADGQRDPMSVRTNGTYADTLLIPQLCELAGKYGADGVWIDGDCWGARADFDPETLAAFTAETGIDLEGRLPAAPEDPYYEEYREYCRELFRRYVRHYTDTVHAAYPSFQIASNWAYTDHMPEAVTANVDFISGDLNPWDSYESARYAARAAASQGMPWDLMSWNHRNLMGGDYAYAYKHPIQLMQEAAAVIALGGGYQNYITQNYDGTPKIELIRRMKPVEEFLRAREPYCFRGTPRHEAVLLLSTEDRHRESESLFSRNGNEKIVGMCSLLCDVGSSLEIAEEHTLQKEHYGYPLIVVPETAYGPAKETVRELLGYAAAGGSLLLIGANTAGIFADSGAPFSLKESRIVNMTADGIDFGTCYGSHTLLFSEGETLAVASAGFGAGEPLAAVLPYGRGKIGVVPQDFGMLYARKAQYMYRQIVQKLLLKLYDQTVRVLDADGRIEIVELEKNGKLLIQLVNANGAHRNPCEITEDKIPSCRDISLKIRLPREPKALILQPEGRELPFCYRDGYAYVTVDRVAVHEVIEVKEA